MLFTHLTFDVLTSDVPASVISMPQHQNKFQLTRPSASFRASIAIALAALLAIGASGCVFLPAVVSYGSAPSQSPTPSPESAPDTDDATASSPDPVGEQPEPDLTMGQINAIDSAESYLRFMGFSRQGLIDQLEFEGYSTDEATFAVDYLNIDWNEQAAIVAESYLDFSSFSRQGLIDQLLYEGFTQEQAEYGVNAVGY